MPRSGGMVAMFPAVKARTGRGTTGIDAGVAPTGVAAAGLTDEG